MPLDAPVIACLALEINRLLPVKIDKIHQPYPDEFLFSCYGGGDSFKILMSLNAQFGRFHLSPSPKNNPLTPSAFCMLLRKHFGGAKLIRVEAVPFERIARFTFEGYDPYSGLSKKAIVLELTGKSANLVIVNEADEIIDCWRRQNTVKPGERELSSGLPYQLPSTRGRWAPDKVDYAKFAALITSVPANVTLEKYFSAQFYGLSGLAVREVILRAGLTPDTPCNGLDSTQTTRLFETFAGWAANWAAGNFEPTGIYDAQDKLIDFAAFRVTIPPANTLLKPLSSLSQTIADQVETHHETLRFNEARQGLIRKIRNQLDKNLKKAGKQEEEARQADRGDELRICGELLTIYGSQITKGSKETALVNHYDPEGREIPIKLDPALTAQENAQLYYKKYQKAKKGQLAIAEQLRKTRETIEYLESLETMAANALSPADLELIKEEFEPVRARNPKNSKPGAKCGAKNDKETGAKPRQFLSPAGHQILVGRNNLQNDRLTFKIAAPGDLWFHTQKIPGSHVIIKALPGVEIDDETLNYACQIAVYFSKGRKSTKVPVDYTQRKNVKKPPAAKPGFVIYDFFKTAIITPDQVLLSTLGLPVEVE
ncbi:MAG TPA: NFACT family protein [Bacillota bacterium]|nr:NFACT family protein [Bacillota bacterium]